MDAQTRIAVFLCHAGTDSTSRPDHTALLEYADRHPTTVIAEDLGTRPKIDPVALSRRLKRQRIERVVLAGDSPGAYKPAITRAMGQAGEDPSRVHLASFDEHGASYTVDGFHDPTERAKAILACALRGVPFSLAAVPGESPVRPATVVVGGGVAGIQAALEIADAGHDVYLVERQGTIGGHMAMFDKTFPTLDCSACILTPKMVSAGQHEKIHLMTYSELEEVTGGPGDYHVKVRTRARHVDVDACVACHDCAAVCPVSVPSEFDDGIAPRKAIYIPFPQAVPNAYLVDAESCVWIQTDGKKCGACIKKCSKDAINLEEVDEIVELEVGNIIVTTGYQTFDAERIERYGYGKLPNVLTALEFERLTNASGPTGGKIVLKTEQYNKRKKKNEWVFHPDGPRPEHVAIIHCVGSRDTNFNPYCSRVCCMYSLKFAHLVREKLPNATCHEFYIDMRAFGKGYEDFFERIKEEGVSVVRGRSAKVEAQNGHMLLRGEDVVSDRLTEMPVDMVILAVGLEPAHGADELAKTLGIARDEDGWFTELNYNIDPTGTERGGIHVAGVCQGPKDIPDTVAQASAVAARVLRSIVHGKTRTSRRRMALGDIETRALQLARF